MSEPIGCRFEVGGEMPKDLIDRFLKLIYDEISDVQGPSELYCRCAFFRNAGLTDPVWYGTADHGLVEDLTSFCYENDLSYIFKSGAKYEYDGQIEWWMPGMKQPVTVTGNQDGNEMVRVDTVRPLVFFMLDIIQQGKGALAKYIGDERFSHILGKITKDYSRLPKVLEKELTGLLPQIPELPPLVIKE